MKKYKYYITFGSGQPLEGYCLPVLAEDLFTVHAFANEYFNKHYCTIYDEEQWERGKRIAATLGYPIEEEIVGRYGVYEVMSDD